jgi:hypothetical protein
MLRKKEREREREQENSVGNFPWEHFGSQNSILNPPLLAPGPAARVIQHFAPGETVDFAICTEFAELHTPGGDSEISSVTHALALHSQVLS